MIYLLHTYWPVVFIIAFFGVFMMFGGLVVLFIWRELFDKRNPWRKHLRWIVGVQLFVALICYFGCFDYTEEQIYQSQAALMQGDE
jgi:peptidoglycan/LPS O-acetylase OafA/YrhL